jgi:hypothetical protein
LNAGYSGRLRSQNEKLRFFYHPVRERLVSWKEILGKQGDILAFAKSIVARIFSNSDAILDPLFNAYALLGICSLLAMVIIT